MSISVPGAWRDTRHKAAHQESYIYAIELDGDAEEVEEAAQVSAGLGLRIAMVARPAMRTNLTTIILQ